MSKSVNEIIENLYNSTDLENCINKFIKPEYKNDFKHDLIIFLHDNYLDKLIELDERNELKFYVARVIINASKNQTTWFLKKYQETDELPENIELRPDTFNINDRILFEEKEIRILDEIENLDDVFNSPFYKAVVKALTNHKSMRELSSVTDIPIATISRAVKRVREHLKTIE